MVKQYIPWDRPQWRRCHYCRARLTPDTRTRDHIVPRSRGGTDAYANLVPACSDCNQAKADRVLACQCSRCRRAWALHAASRLRDDWFDRATRSEFTRWPDH